MPWGVPANQTNSSRVSCLFNVGRGLSWISYFFCQSKKTTAAHVYMCLMTIYVHLNVIHYHLVLLQLEGQ